MLKYIDRCITSDPKVRPDIVEVSTFNFHVANHDLNVANIHKFFILQVGSIISEIMMQYTDKLRVKEFSLQKKLDRERKRTQK